MRRNYFGDIIAQPGDTLADIGDAIEARHGFYPTFYSAEIYSESDETYKFGGEMYCEESSDPFSFDGFEEWEDAHKFLLDVVGIKDDQIAKPY